MQLYMPTRVYSEENCVVNHAAELAAVGKKAMLVTGKHSAKATGALQDVIQALGDTPYVLFDCIEENPSVETVMEGGALAIAEQVDFCIGIGGGSPMDAAKAIALMAANPDKTEEALYAAEVLPHLNVVCVPTTCGTGSEVTPYAVLTRHVQKTKRSISHKIFPVLALLDAKYLRHMSRNGLVNTCTDALAHLFESFLNTNANELNRIYAREGLQIWAQFRDRLLTDTLEDSDYPRMLHASLLAGMAIAHTGTSLPHGMSYPVTYTLNIPHGKAVGLFLGGFVEGYDDRELAQQAVELLGFASPAALRSYLRKLLGEAQISGELLETCAAKLLEDPAKLKNYPFTITAQELTSMVN